MYFITIKILKEIRKQTLHKQIEKKNNLSIGNQETSLDAKTIGQSYYEKQDVYYTISESIPTGLSDYKRETVSLQQDGCQTPPYSSQVAARHLEGCVKNKAPPK